MSEPPILKTSHHMRIQWHFNTVAQAVQLTSQSHLFDRTRNVIISTVIGPSSAYEVASKDCWYMYIVLNRLLCQ